MENNKLKNLETNTSENASVSRFLRRSVSMSFLISISFLLTSIFYILTSTPAHAALAVSNSGPNNLQKGLVGWWTFDGANLKNNVTDSSINGINGFLKNFTSTSSSIMAGKVGQALKFNGTNQYVDVSGLKNYISSGDVSMSVWFKPSLTIDSNHYTTGAQVWALFDYNDANSTNDVGFDFCDSQTSNQACVAGTGGKLAFRMWANNNATFFMHNATTSQSSWTKNVWYHVVGTYNSAAGEKIYINGVLSGSQPATGRGTTVSQSAAIGGASADIGGTNLFPGSIDDFRVYNRTLSATEVTQLYNATAGSKVSVSNSGPNNLNSGLVGWWTFDGANLKNNVADSSGTGNNGNLVGFTSTSSAVVSGKVGQALRFNGTSQIANVSSIKNNISSGDASVSLWFKPSITINSSTYQSAGSHTRSVFNYNDNSSTNDVGFYFCDIQTSNGGCATGTFGKLGFTIIGNNNATFFAHAATTSQSSWTQNVWYHVVGTYNSATGEKIYINGALVGSQSATGRGTTVSQSGTIGGTVSAASYGYFPGAIDDVRVYDRALSATEVSQLYNSTAGSKVSTSNSGPNNLQNGLLGWWTFDGANLKNNVADSSGQGNNGNLVSFGATSTAVVSGKMGQALKFNGTSSYVNASATAFNFERTDPFTVSAWVRKTLATTTSDTPAIVGRSDASNNNRGYSLYICDSSDSVCSSINNTVVAEFIDDVHTSGHATAWSTPVNSFKENNAWQHIVMVSSGDTANIKIYINGVSQTLSKFGTSDFTTGTMKNSLNLRIGDDYTGDWMNGALDDVRVYNRALSATEVSQLYNMGK